MVVDLAINEIPFLTKLKYPNCQKNRMGSQLLSLSFTPNSGTYVRIAGKFNGNLVRLNTKILS